MACDKYRGLHKEEKDKTRKEETREIDIKTCLEKTQKLEKRNKNRIHSMSQKNITATNEKLNRTNRKTHEKDEKNKRNCSLQKNTFLKLN